MKKLLTLALLCLLWLPSAQADYIILRPEDEGNPVIVSAEEGVTVKDWCAIAETGRGGIIENLWFYAEMVNEREEWIKPRAEVRVIGPGNKEYVKDFDAYALSYRVGPGATSYLADNLLPKWIWIGAEPPRMTLGGLKRMTVHIRCESLEDDPLPHLQRVPAENVTAEVDRVAPRWMNGQLWETLRVTIHNGSGEDFLHPAAMVGAYSAQGRLLYADCVFVTDYVGSLILPDGSSVVIDITADSYEGFDLRDFLEQTGETVAEYRCILH